MRILYNPPVVSAGQLLAKSQELMSLVRPGSQDIGRLPMSEDSRNRTIWGAEAQTVADYARLIAEHPLTKKLPHATYAVQSCLRGYDSFQPEDYIRTALFDFVTENSTNISNLIGLLIVTELGQLPENLSLRFGVGAEIYIHLTAEDLMVDEYKLGQIPAHATQLISLIESGIITKNEIIKMIENGTYDFVSVSTSNKIIMAAEDSVAFSTQESSQNQFDVDIDDIFYICKTKSGKYIVIATVNDERVIYVGKPGAMEKAEIKKTTTGFTDRFSSGTKVETIVTNLGSVLLNTPPSNGFGSSKRNEFFVTYKGKSTTSVKVTQELLDGL